MNEVTLMGNLGNRPELRKTQSGTAVCNFNLATNKKYRDKEGSQQQKTTWHKVVVWGKLAETCTQYLDKGRQVLIKGELQTRVWTDNKGQKRYSVEVEASNVKFLSSNNNNTSEDVQAEVQDSDLPDLE